MGDSREGVGASTVMIGMIGETIMAGSIVIVARITISGTTGTEGIRAGIKDSKSKNRNKD